MTKEELFMALQKEMDLHSIGGQDGFYFKYGGSFAHDLLQAENARLRYELELLKNPAEKDLHDQLSKAVGDSLNDQAAEEIARLRDVLSAAMENIRNADYAVALVKIEHALKQ